MSRPSSCHLHLPQSTLRPSPSIIQHALQGTHDPSRPSSHSLAQKEAVPGDQQRRQRARWPLPLAHSSPAFLPLTTTRAADATVPLLPWTPWHRSQRLEAIARRQPALLPSRSLPSASPTFPLLRRGLQVESKNNKGKQDRERRGEDKGQRKERHDVRGGGAEGGEGRVVGGLAYEVYPHCRLLSPRSSLFSVPPWLGIAGREGRTEGLVVMVAVSEVLSSLPPTIGPRSFFFSSLPLPLLAFCFFSFLIHASCRQGSFVLVFVFSFSR